jgi:hypothetical protein
MRSRLAMRAARLAQRLYRRPRHETFTGRCRSGVQAGLALNPAAAKIEGRKGRTKQSSAFNLLQRLEQHETEVLYFMHDLAVPFTNNLAQACDSYGRKSNRESQAAFLPSAALRTLAPSIPISTPPENRASACCTLCRPPSLARCFYSPEDSLLALTFDTCLGSPG